MPVFVPRTRARATSAIHTRIAMIGSSTANAVRFIPSAGASKGRNRPQSGYTIEGRSSKRMAVSASTNAIGNAGSHLRTLTSLVGPVVQVLDELLDDRRVQGIADAVAVPFGGDDAGVAKHG